MSRSSLSEKVGSATTFLFVPGSKSDLFDKAERSGADMVIVDLEDAVAASAKDSARESVAEWLKTHTALVRINAPGTPWHDDDLRMLAAVDRPVGVMLPKAERMTDLRATVSALPQTPVVALIESAQGLLSAADIATVPGVSRLAFGSLDYMLDLGCLDSAPDESQLAHPRAIIAVASAAARLPGPIDGVHTDLAETADLDASCQRAVQLGFSAKLCIHPHQLARVAAAFTPTEEQARWAVRVIEADTRAAGMATSLDGELVDRPQVGRARLIVRRLGGSAPATSQLPPMERDLGINMPGGLGA